MLRTTLLVLASLLLASPATAQTTKQFQLVGFTTNTVPADSGYIGMTKACQLEFEASRMCTTLEVIETVAIPGLPANESAWVRPISLGFEGLNLFEVSGAAIDTINQMTCDGWGPTSNTTPTGLAITDKGIVAKVSCTVPKPVACCALTPVPEPSVSQMVLPGIALLAALSGQRMTCEALG